tara:strand:+ start:328 stop:648 length:321 start_codon:yes stop_codon:yes gene_type:complete
MRWSSELEQELTLLLKEWLKHHGKAQIDLKTALNTNSSRMPVIIEELKKIYLKGEIRAIASKLCEIETNWLNSTKTNNIDSTNQERNDPLGQLDLLIEAINEDCKD